MKLIQLTDFHLFSNTKETLQGYCTYECLKLVVDSIISNVNLTADAIFITGDISEDKTLESYQLALKQVERLNLPIYFLAGNHDDKECMKSVFSRSSLAIDTNEIHCKDWILIKVDTVQYGEDSGLLSADAKKDLEKRIAGYRNIKVALFMHHHPVAVGIPLVDGCMLLNSKDIFSLADSGNKLKSIICGHAHTQLTGMHNDCVIDVCPATCFQWKAGARTLETDDERGYKLLSFGEQYHSETFLL